jgi:transposase InsO family protein
MEHVRKDMKENKDTKYFEKGGLLYLKKGDRAFERVLVPECLLRMHHNSELAAHQGHKRMLHQFSQFWFWPRMARDAIRWVRGCVECKKRKTPRPMRQGITRPVFSKFPNHTVAIDIVGPMVETSEGNLWILTMIDVFTRWPLAVAIPNRKSTVIAKVIFERWVCERGVPHQILSDQGRELVSKGVHSICERMGIKKIQTSGYNPTGNACVERFHLLAAISILHKRSGMDWDGFISPVLFAYHLSTTQRVFHPSIWKPVATTGSLFTSPG